MLKRDEASPSDSPPIVGRQPIAAAAPDNLFPRPGGETPPESAWSWLPLGVLLQFWFQYTDGATVARFDLEVFFPLFAAWMAHRYGPKAIKVLFLLALAPVLFNASLRLSDSAYVYVGIGLPTGTFLLALFLAITFLRVQWIPPLAGGFRSWWRPWWRWTVWLAVIAVSVTAVIPWNRGFDPLAHLNRKFLTFHAFGNLGTILPILICGLAVRWPQAVAKWRSLWWAKRARAWKILAVTVTTAIASALVFELKFDAGPFTVGFGQNAGWADLGVLCLVLTASRAVDWKLLCCYLVALFLGSTLPFHHSVSPASLFGTEWSTQISWSALISQGMSGALLGVVFSALWRDRGSRAWIPGFLAAVAAFQFFSAAFSIGGFTYWYLAAAAFVAGLIWRGRGLVLGPLLIQLCGVLSLSSAAAVREGLVSGAYAMAWLGVIAFTFAFFGLLSNRFDRLRDAADLNAAAASPDGPGSGLTAIDITALARVVRRLDTSATIKAFSAVLAPLIAFQAGRVVRAIANFVSDSSDLDLTNVVRAFAVAGVLTPFGFLILDWAARKQAWRYVSAIIGAAAGTIVFAPLGALLGLFPNESEGSDLYPIIIIGAVLLLGLGTALMARTPRMRLAGSAAAAVLPALAVFGLRLDSAPSETGASPLLQIAFSIVLLAFLIWWSVRAVRLRIDLSGDWPRSFLLGAIPGRSFWVRLAFLIGLPASLWNLAALRTPAFWMFLISRPLIYLGFVVLFKNPGLRPGPAIGLSMLLIASGHFAFSAAKRLAARRIWAIEGGGSPSRPILFLRSFQDDQFEVEPPKWDLVGRWLNLWSFRRNVDQILIDECAQYGPVIALGRPGEKKVPFGAARYYVTQQEWQTVVTDAARRAQAIVVAAGDSPGVRWEYELLSREHLLDRTLLLFRPAKGEDQANRRALDAFSRATTQIQVGDIARNDHLIALFDSGNGPRILMARKPSAACYLVALRAHFHAREKNQPQPLEQEGRESVKNKAASILAAFAALAVLFWAAFPPSVPTTSPDQESELGAETSAAGSRQASELQLENAIDHYKVTIREFRTAIRLTPDDASAHHNLGLALLHKGDRDGAVTEFREALRLNPDHANAHSNLGVALGEKGDWNGAITEYRAAIRLTPDDARAHYNLGLALLHKGDRDGAVTELREALRLNPDHANAHSNLGVALGEKGDWNGAITEYRAAIRLTPDDARAHHRLGVALGEMHDLDGAITEYRYALRLNPDDADAHSNLGVALTEKGDWDGAITEYRDALRLDSDHPNAHYNLGRVLAEKGDWDGAVTELRDALRLNPDDANAHHILAVALAEKGDWDGAITEFRAALRLNSNQPHAHYSLGVALAEKGDWDGAITEYRYALRLNPDDADAHSNLGVALTEKGDWDGAITEFRAALRLNPDNASVHYGLGLALGVEGDRDGAIAEFRKAVALDADDPDLLNSLGGHLAEAGRSEEAIPYLEKAVQIRPEDSDILNSLALALAGTGQYNDAIAKYQRALRLAGHLPDATRAEIHLHLAQALTKLGRLEEASREFEEAYQLNPQLKNRIE